MGMVLKGTNTDRKLYIFREIDTYDSMLHMHDVLHISTNTQITNLKGEEAKRVSS